MIRLNAILASTALLVGLTNNHPDIAHGFADRATLRGTQDVRPLALTAYGDPYRTMVFPGGDWDELSPESVGVDSRKLTAALDYLRSNSGRSGLARAIVVRDGYLIWQGRQADQVQGVWSITKSFTNAVLGVLDGDGVASLDTVAYPYVPTLRQHYATVTLRHFATMTSGYRALGDDDDSYGQSGTPFFPAAPLFAPPGSAFAYWDSAANEYAYVLTQIAREPLERVFERRIASFIGMNRDGWRWDNYGQVDGIVVNGGAGNQAMVSISAKQLGRFGLLFLNRGKWNGRQVLRESWVDQSMALQVPTGIPLGNCKVSGFDGRGIFGLLAWWTNGILPEVRYRTNCTAYVASAERQWPDAPIGTRALIGYNNNRMFVIPEWQMVVVRLGLDEQDGAVSEEVYNRFLEKMGEAVTTG
jgi:CubicO group peptidase (beta-lactamase class C family)